MSFLEWGPTFKLYDYSVHCIHDRTCCYRVRGGPLVGLVRITVVRKGGGVLINVYEGISLKGVTVNHGGRVETRRGRLVGSLT